MFNAAIKGFVAFFTTLIMVFQSGILMLTPAEERPTDFEQRKNVIFMIGDGMGFNSLNKTKHEENIAELVMETFPIKGESKTASSSSSVTDSAAGGTALSSAIRTTNGCISVYPYDMFDNYSHPMNLTELAISQGKLAGVITTDSTSGATPGSFSAHTSSRKNEADITYQQLHSDLTLVWGAKTKSFTQEAAAENGFNYIYDKASMDALTEGTRSFAQFESEVWHKDAKDGMPTLAEMTAKAIDLIDDDEDGFFLMVEGAHIDKNNHGNNGEGMKDALQSFDDAIKVALDYAKADGDTLIIITADHETGGITLTDGEYVYTTGSHTGVNVPLFVYGCDNFIKNGEAIKNKEVSRRVACIMGEKNFPIRTVGSAGHGGEDNAPIC